MKVNYFVEQIDKNKNLAIWYYGKNTIAEISYLNRKIKILPPDIVFLKTDAGKTLENYCALNYIHSKNFSSDRQLYNHNDSHFGLDFFGEFDFIYENVLTGAAENLANDECFSYTDAIEFAKLKIKESKFWIDTDKDIKKVTTIDVPENWVKYVVLEK